MNIPGDKKDNQLSPGYIFVLLNHIIIWQLGYITALIYEVDCTERIEEVFCAIIFIYLDSNILHLNEMSNIKDI